MKHLCGKTKFPRYLMWRSFIPEFVLNTIRASAETAEISSWSLSGASCAFQVPNDDFFPNFLLQLRHFFSQTTIRVKALRKISRKSILLWEVGGGVSFNPWFARWLCCFNSHIFCSMPIQFVLFIQFIYIYIYHLICIRILDSNYATLAACPAFHDAKEHPVGKAIALRKSSCFEKLSYTDALPQPFLPCHEGLSSP